MTAFPLDPRFSRVLLSSAHLGCLVEILSILSMLYVSPVFYIPMEKREAFNEVSMSFYENQAVFNYIYFLLCPTHARRTPTSQIRQQFYHPNGDLISLLLVYRAYVKSSHENHRNASPTGELALRADSNQSWCRTHFINKGRLNTAVKVRAQLKQISRGCGLTTFRSCGTDLNLVAQAFLQSGFRDQVRKMNVF
ncbi:putative ATP-dependent RNA helicase DHX33 [Fasciolopsis buskii]|uniref:RNA helicase n=1 Tax=Fasciolopsis buskii TaxID=27845 RepID=A0A8E0RKW9_9TREM|nr:putative ATP-dependent RNA helicase DHX33 [Fasciolopsis buski]